jgi:hypothetical protein
LEYFCDYFLTLFLVPGIGLRAAQKYATGLLDHFPPGQIIPLADSGSSCRVRGDTAPWFAQPRQSEDPEPGFLSVPVTVPMILSTSNAI